MRSYELAGHPAQHGSGNPRAHIQTDERKLTPDAAGYLLSMRLPSGDEDRVNELSAKARAGSLTDSERQELDSYLHVGSLLAVMQSKARRLLKQAQSS